jgi:uncharacterized delta-60 repeat protein
MIIQADGKIVLVGYSFITGNSRDWCVVRLNPDGSRDRGFGTNGVVTIDFNSGLDEAYSVLQQADGKLLIGGFATGFTKDFAIARLNTNGILDTTFATSGKYTRDTNGDVDQIYAMTLQTVSGVNYVVAVGNSVYGGTDAFDAIAFRLNLSGGTLDTAFNTGSTYSGLNIFRFNQTPPQGLTPNDYSRGVAIDANNKIVIGGYNSNFDVGAARLNTNGTLDTSFNGNGRFTAALTQFSNFNYMLYQGGNIVLVGCIGISEINVVRFNMTTPALDTTFGTSNKFSYAPNTFANCSNSAALDSSGRILLAASVSSANVANARDSIIARLSANGIADSTFSTSPANGIFNIQQSSTRADNAIGVAVDSNGKIVIAGIKSITNADQDFYVLRMNP